MDRRPAKARLHRAALMKKLDLRDIASHIHVILTCMPKSDSRAGGWQGEQAVKAATSRIMELFKRSVVLVPDDIPTPGSGYSHPMPQPGEFGVTEPWPFEPGCRPPSTPKPPVKGDVS